MELAPGISDYAYVMNKGQIADEGPSGQFLRQPERLHASSRSGGTAPAP